MDDFFKGIKDNLENRPEPAFETSAWKRMHQRLTEEKGGKKRRIPIFFWWILGISSVVGLMGSNVFLWDQWQRTQNQVAQIRGGNQVDTIFQTKIIYQVDTIYKTIPNTAATYSLPKVAPYFQTPIAGRMPTFHSVKQPVFPAFSRMDVNDMAIWKVQELAGGDFDKPEELKDRTAWGTLSPLSKSPLQIVAAANPLVSALPVGRFAEQPPQSASFLEQVAQVFEPKGFDIGLSGGYAGLLQSGIRNENGFSVGINGQIRFSDKLQMWMDVSFYQLQYTSTRMDSLRGIPVVVSPSDDFEFTKAVVPQNAFQYAIGMQYTFANRSRWQPFVGVGYGAASLLPYEVQYEFRNATNAEELVLDKLVRQNELVTNLLFFKTGVTYEFAQKYSWILEGNYRHSFYKSGLQAPNIWGVKTGLVYHF